jgi:hypothetical protein
MTDSLQMGERRQNLQKMIHRNALRLFLTVLEVSQLVVSNEKIKPWKVIHLFALNKFFCKKFRMN